jgi:hypothetical protein
MMNITADPASLWFPVVEFPRECVVGNETTKQCVDRHRQRLGGPTRFDSKRLAGSPDANLIIEL